ncbi:hypothetical protein HYDPIDRAFT_118983 [Hydnomerulius pinastri MD-312]|uniref:Uncharacterized protein n=1 Tax=Hydnomerulius pinastri MD-312 TaxID=994086 RepID=A0A0C9V0Y5_9AGAM|nr:hypothetical protein HYDPIDRAFT_118983 [Hydnomerulius pinastri MD-312]
MALYKATLPLQLGVIDPMFTHSLLRRSLGRHMELPNSFCNMRACFSHPVPKATRGPLTSGCAQTQRPLNSPSIRSR